MSQVVVTYKYTFSYVKEKSGGLGLLAYMSNSDDEVSKPPSPVISLQVLVDDVCNKFLMDINNSTSKSKKKKKSLKSFSCSRRA